MVIASDSSGNVASSATTFQSYGTRELTGAYQGAQGAGGLIARLYMAAFVREPESSGFSYWISEHGEGRTLIQIADGFALGAEFRSYQGTATDVDYVQLMYRRVLDRQSDLDGQAFWVDRLSAGLTRSELLLMFSDSLEFRALTHSD